MDKEKIRKIREYRESGIPIAKIADIFGVSVSTVYRAIGPKNRRPGNPRKYGLRVPITIYVSPEIKTALASGGNINLAANNAFDAYFNG